MKIPSFIHSTKIRSLPVTPKPWRRRMKTKINHRIWKNVAAVVTLIALSVFAATAAGLKRQSKTSSSQSSQAQPEVAPAQVVPPSPTPSATPVGNPTPTPPGQPVLDHFKAYVSDGQPLNVTVFLQDQFDAGPVSYTVDHPFWFANPVEKTHNGVVTPITNFDTHLEMYFLPPNAAIPPTTRYVNVNNQFGLQTLTVQDAALLGVPTQKNGTGSPHDVDHFKFYDATGTPINTIVNLLDQFHQEPNVLVRQPRYFANPVKKIHNGVVTPITHPNDFLVCYDIVPQAVPVPLVVSTLNQFGPGSLVIHPADLLCVPSQKLSFVVATPTPAETPTPTPSPAPTDSPNPTATATATATATSTATATTLQLQLQLQRLQERPRRRLQPLRRRIHPTRRPQLRPQQQLQWRFQRQHRHPRYTRLPSSS